jgi:hypothetical protein
MRDEYRALSPAYRLIYVVGVLDGWDAIGAVSKNLRESDIGIGGMFSDINRCAMDKRMTQGQLHAIVDKYIVEHPADWHFGASQLVFLALNEVCKR